jgi:hypothetical protein
MCFVDRRARVICNRGRTFNRDVSIGAACTGIDTGKEITRSLNVGGLDELEKLIGREVRGSGRKLIVVGRTFC